MPQSKLGKTEHGSVRSSNLTGIKTSVPVIIERDCDNLKIGLLNVRGMLDPSLPMLS